MKVRNGFVSNSSSSSFIMLIPKNFNIDDYDFSSNQKTLDYNDTNEEEVKTLFKKLQKEEYLDGYDGDNYYALTEIFNDLVIASIETGPDDGHVTLLSDKEIEKIKKLINLV